MKWRYYSVERRINEGVTFQNDTGVSVPPLPWDENAADCYPWVDVSKADSHHAVFRLFSPDAVGYLLQCNYTNEIQADGENPFDPDCKTVLSPLHLNLMLMF